MTLQLSDLYIYPVKSLGGIRLTEAQLDSRGLRHDRRWLIVNERNQFMTQRQTPGMAFLKVEPAYNGFLLRHSGRPEMLPLFVPFEATPDKTLFVTIWDDMVFAWRARPECDEWLTAALGQTCKLVYMSDMVCRTVEPEFNPNNQLVSFADGYPYLLVGQNSLAELNSHLAEPVGLDRFRPNLVFSGGEAFTEDTWYEFQIGEVTFRAVRACARCVLTTINQHTGQRHPHTEPLRTLASYRIEEGKAIFGQNVTGPATGILHVGDTLTVKSYKAL
ncbi:MOSC domain-containing protein [Hymenobacter taeanensis]|uniref:MOSC domain-containing protein n=1 Tax=Hymenobacter taeanensis TaxID=2735321 RepID=A0A6M6BHN2_9BACT|nr:MULTISPECIES: MOSC N-terminal beta barrel domain-containing protein [Hymenobacter]QJX47687.1 MOSC domain-containing protein [Hymenobacter taeanensis]UOQ82829.1 MOSC domain-containing protein [Hymenobacter sp. 5414T-23]